MNFLSKEHEERFNDLRKRGRGVAAHDKERLVVMYIMAGYQELFDKAEELYDFKQGYLNFEFKEQEDGTYKVMWGMPLSSSEKNLITLALDLYSGRNNVYVSQLFNSLDSKNTKLALRALEYIYS